MGRKEKWSRGWAWVTPMLRGPGSEEPKASEKERRWVGGGSGSVRQVQERKFPLAQLHPSVWLFLPFRHFLLRPVPPICLVFLISSPRIAVTVPAPV